MLPRSAGETETADVDDVRPLYITPWRQGQLPWSGWGR